MKGSYKKSLIGFIIFAAFTLLAKIVDVQPVGPMDTEIGFATLNMGFLKAFNGIFSIEFRSALYLITQFCGVIAIAVCACMGLAGLSQWIKKKNLWYVDPGIIAMGLYYIVVIGFYAAFMFCAVNYRPVLVDGEIESSYPSSHTMLAITVVAGLMLYTEYFSHEEKKARVLYRVVSWVFVAVTILGRLFSGVHWLTDIIGSVLLSFAIIMLYEPLRDSVRRFEDKMENKRLNK